MMMYRCGICYVEFQMVNEDNEPDDSILAPHIELRFGGRIIGRPICGTCLDKEKERLSVKDNEL